MKRRTLAIAIGAMLLVGILWDFRESIGGRWMLWLATPSQTFSAANAPPAPDYANNANWAALPGKHDLADFVPVGAEDQQARAGADVFFVHATTYAKSTSWNQQLDDAATNKFTDETIMAAQASAFNGCCRVYAPRYRQATLAATLASSPSGEKALSLAYRDVEAAFDYFIAHYNQGRPFILAGHDQGARHLALLLQRRIIQPALRDRLIAAYVVGVNLDRDVIAKGAPEIAVCTEPKTTGCYLSWNSAGPNADRDGFSKNSVCVNPLTWRADGERGDFAVNLGSVAIGEGERSATAQLRGADAQCMDGRVRVSELRTKQFMNLLRSSTRDNFHLADYGLFYMNVRQNAQVRTVAWLAVHSPNAVRVRDTFDPNDAANFVPGHP